MSQLKIFIILLFLSQKIISQEQRDTVQLDNITIHSPKTGTTIIKKALKRVKRNYIRNDILWFKVYHHTSINKKKIFHIDATINMKIKNYKKFSAARATISDTSNYYIDKGFTTRMQSTDNAPYVPFYYPFFLNGVISSTSFKKLPFITDINKYEFNTVSNDSLFVINFKVKSHVKPHLHYCGDLIINKKDYAILYINYKLDTSKVNEEYSISYPSRSKDDIWTFMKNNTQIYFKKYINGYGIKSIKSDFSVVGAFKKKELKYIFKSKSNIIRIKRVTNQNKQYRSLYDLSPINTQKKEEIPNEYRALIDSLKNKYSN